MKYLLLSAGALTTFLLLASCQTAEVLSSCKTNNWQTVGEEDGAKGLDPLNRFNAHLFNCKDTIYRPDEKLWRQGYEIGIRRFCKPLTGLAHGQNRKHYFDNCPVGTNVPFKEGYDLGIEQSVRTTDVANAEKRISKVEAEIVAQEKLIADGKMDAGEGALRIRDNRKAIDLLRVDLAKKEEAHSKTNAAVEAFRTKYANS